jgi:hypothetical protein
VAKQAVADRLLLPADADRLIVEAAGSGVLAGDAESSPENRARGRARCRSN